MIDEIENLISLLIEGGTYYYSHDANVVLVADDFTGLDKMTVPVMQVAIKNGCTFIAAPNIIKETYEGSAIKKIIDAFLSKNMKPSFMFCVRVYPDLIMDEEICVVKDAMIDHDNLLKKIMDIGLEWLSVKDEETGSETTGIMNAHVQREWQVLSTTVIACEKSMGYLGDLVSRLTRNDYGKPDII